MEIQHKHESSATAADSEQPATKPDPGKSNAPVVQPKHAFERWAVDKFGVSFNGRGRASGFVAGRRAPGATAKAAFVNGARSLYGIPIGKTMTEEEFTKCIDAVKAIEVSANGAR